MPEKLKTLAEFKLPHMVLTCNQCGRKGRYNIARLVENHGADKPICDFIDIVGRTCHRWVNPTEHRGCGLGCDDLVYMFMSAPATDAYATKQNEEFDRKKNDRG